MFDERKDADNSELQEHSGGHLPLYVRDERGRWWNLRQPLLTDPSLSGARLTLRRQPGLHHEFRQVPGSLDLRQSKLVRDKEPFRTTINHLSVNHLGICVSHLATAATII